MTDVHSRPATRISPAKPRPASAPATGRLSTWRWLPLPAIAFLTACATQAPAPIEERELNDRVRTPAREQSAGVQVYPLKNPAVAELTEQADQAEARGDLGQAAVLLERALRIQPRDPELLQHMAEVQLQRGQYEQALSFATRSHDIGPRVGELCARNWRTMSLAQERLGDNVAAGRSVQRAEQCMVTRPTGL
ncbi:MAG: tetratricopeptide repeat protein [Xanthomonadales bacterium]|nr:tetratricopeptide repeat protein [Xanthomonadales bacterium]